MKRSITFLSDIFGEDAAKSLEMAGERSARLGDAIVPRAILAWIKSSDQFEGPIPGAGNNMSFQKSEDGYSGYIEMDQEIYTFERSSVFHLTACVAVSLGLPQPLSKGIKDLDIEKVGRSIDILAKARLLSKKLKKGALGATKPAATGPGPAAAPQSPKAPVPPQPTAPPTLQQRTSSNKIPSGVPKPVPSYTVKITKAEAEKDCPFCGGQQFEGSAFAGCLCFSDLAKSSNSISLANGGYALEFCGDCDRAAIVTFLEALGR